MLKRSKLLLPIWLNCGFTLAKTSGSCLGVQIKTEALIENVHQRGLEKLEAALISSEFVVLQTRASYLTLQFMKDF